ncbi:unnamed protein product [Caenorhabditis sp. 36 PRJEB53466]|nr:unnamed protein product [Caenorhabditis sp. 36 PRJEB53466]
MSSNTTVVNISWLTSPSPGLDWQSIYSKNVETLNLNLIPIAILLNSIHFAVLSRKHLRSNANFVWLLVVSLCNLVYLSCSWTSVLLHWLRPSGQECFRSFVYSDIIVQMIGNALRDIALRASSWIVISIGFLRAFTKFRPRAVFWVTVTVTLLASFWCLTLWPRHHIYSVKIEMEWVWITVDLIFKSFFQLCE